MGSRCRPGAAPGTVTRRRTCPWSRTDLRGSAAILSPHPSDAALKSGARETPGDNGPWIVPHPAQRYRDEAIESENRRIAKEGKQHLTAGKACQHADHP